MKSNNKPKQSTNNKKRTVGDSNSRLVAGTLLGFIKTTASKVIDLTSFTTAPAIAIFVFATLVSPLFCSNVFADDSITVTIDDPTLDVNIAPKNANGTFSKSNASVISVKTTNSTGYTLGIRANSSTNYDKLLLNGSETSSAISSITSPITEAQFKALSTTYNNQWGYMPSRYCTGDTKDTCSDNGDNTFFKAPNTTGDILDVTESANPTTANTYDLALGARVDISQTLGSYSNVYLVSATANAISYSIVYDDNIVSNMPTDENSGQATGGVVSFSSNTPTMSGYKFLGWCTVPVTTPASSTSACATAGGTYYAAGSTTTISAATAFHLYAMWDKVATLADITYMQDTFSCDDTAAGTSKTLIDNRDNEQYLVAKLNDGKCWMLDNLRLDLTNSTVLSGLTTSNTHVDSNSLTSLKSGNRSAGNQYATAGVSNWTSRYSYSAPLVAAGYKNNTTTSYGSGSGKVGVYYNYCAASAGSYCYGSGTGQGTSSGNAEYDLCPAGWRMPTGDTSGEYQALYAAYSSNATDFRAALSTPLSGYFYLSSQYSLGSSGNFWSSTRFDDYSVYSLDVDASNVDPASNGSRSLGFSMRCVAQ